MKEVSQNATESVTGILYYKTKEKDLFFCAAFGCVAFVREGAR